MSKQIIIEFMLKWTDPDRPVEGTEKLRIFDHEDDARQELERLPTYAPLAHSIQLIKQTTLIKREQLI